MMPIATRARGARGGLLQGALKGLWKPGADWLRFCRKEPRMVDDASGIREGEIAVELPGGHDAGLYFIGRIRTPWPTRDDCPKNARESDALCTIEVDARYRVALTGVETCSHLLVLYWMHQARRDLVLQAPRH